MSSPLATPNGELEPFPSLEAAAAPPPATTAAGESASSRVVVDEARRRCEDRCTADADLRESLGKLIELCETLTSRVQTLEPQIVDLQTSLTLTQSNLTLSLANTEMLEDALRSNAQSRDVGWRRSDSTSRRPVAASMSYPSAAEHAKIVVSAPTPATPQSPATTPTSPPMPSEGRFFKFRFGAKTPSPTSPAYSQQQTQPGHLTSASLPSLGLSIEDEARAKQLEELASKQESLKLKASEIDARHQELIELEKKIKAREEEVETLLKEREAELEKVRQELQKEKETCRELEQDKARVQDEIETLTQSLFEEANNMVAVERRRMAEVEALLRETEEERDAVRGAMRVVEGENGRLRELSAQGRSSGESTRPSPADEPAPSPITPPRPGSSHSSHEGDRSILTDKEADPALSSGVGSINISTDVLPPDLPLLPEGTPDPWKAQTPSGASPKTPPRIHALPTETSPWAESRASS